MKIFAIKSYTFLLLIVFLVTGQACIDDKGNYEYIELSKAIIEKTSEVEYVYTTPNSTLRIEPSISFTEGKGYGDFSYEWHRYVTNTEEVLSRGDTPALDIILPTSMNRSSTYQVLFIAKNNQSGVKFTKKYAVVVRNTMQAGYLALTEKSDGLELEMIANFNDTLTLYPNLLQLTGSEYPRTGRKPIDIVTFNDVTAPSPYDTNNSRVKYSVYLITDQGTDRLKPEDFSFIEDDYSVRKVSVISSKFLSQQGVIPEKMECYVSGVHYIYMNKHWFFANRTIIMYYFMDPINTPYGTENYYTPAPYLVNSGQAAVLYDMDRNRFMHQRVGMMDLYASKEVLCTRALTDNEGDKYKFNDPNYELVYMGHIRQLNAASTGFGVLRHKTSGVHEIWTFQYTSTTVSKLNRYTFPSTLDYSTVKFLVHHPIENYLYCATEDKLYVLPLTSQNPSAVEITGVIPDGHKVSMFKYPFKSGTRYLLALGTYDPAKNMDNCGSLRMYTVDAYTGKLNLANHPATPTANGYQIPMEWDGLGKVTGLDYKEK